MVLGDSSPGRVGRRRFLERAPRKGGSFSFSRRGSARVSTPVRVGSVAAGNLQSMPPRQPPRGRPPRTGKPLPKKRVVAKPEEREAPKQWGSLARKGVGRMRDDRPYKAADEFEAAAPPERKVDKWVRTDVRDEAQDAVARGSSRPARDRTKRPVPEVAAELDKAVGAKS